MKDNSQQSKKISHSMTTLARQAMETINENVMKELQEYPQTMQDIRQLLAEGKNAMVVMDGIAAANTSYKGEVIEVAMELLRRALLSQKRTISSLPHINGMPGFLMVRWEPGACFDKPSTAIAIGLAVEIAIDAEYSPELGKQILRELGVDCADIVTPERGVMISNVPITSYGQ
ncbi:MAG: hypothetical protein ABSA33_05910 [Candidatus Micrarchaeaceae archaeon]